MKKLVFLFFVINFTLCLASETVYVYDGDGARTPYELSMVDSVSFAEPNALSIYPTEKNMASTGGRFSVSIYTAKPWTATVSDPTAIILSKSSGKGGETDSIYVSAFPNSNSRPYSETVTFKSEDGTIAVLRVNVSVDNEYFYVYVLDEEGLWTSSLDDKEVPRVGGEFEIRMSSNTYWELYSYDSGVHLSPSSGKYDGTIKVTVDPNTDYASYKRIYFKAIGGLSAYIVIKQDGEKISVDSFCDRLGFEGGESGIEIKSNTKWSVSSNRDWAMMSAIDGEKDSSISIYVDSGTYQTRLDTATITFTTTLGNEVSTKIYRVGYTGKGEDVTDINGRSYPTVWIGGQNWMAENLKCNKYDTESEAYNAKWLTNNTIPTSEDDVYTPYYADATKATKPEWMTDDQMTKLGYLYNWAAAVGVENGYDYGTSPFTGNRQGICPNGWHIPTSAEWDVLKNYIEVTQEKGIDTAGKHLKTTSGWFNNGNGTDTYGFAALPADTADGSSVNVGYVADFWTATPYNYLLYAYFRSIKYHSDVLSSTEEDYFWKDEGLSVRCIKD